jgi:hypothetical protein
LGVGTAGKVFPQSTGCLFYLFLDHDSLIHTNSASTITFSGNRRVQENDTSTFSTECPDLTSFSSFVTLHFTASTEPTITIFIRAAPNLSTLTWLVFLI